MSEPPAPEFLSRRMFPPLSAAAGRAAPRTQAAPDYRGPSQPTPIRLLRVGLRVSGIPPPTAAVLLQLPQPPERRCAASLTQLGPASSLYLC